MQEQKHETKHDNRRQSSVGFYTAALGELLQFDDYQIYNTADDEDIFELFMSMKDDLPEKQWETVLRSAIRKTSVKQKDDALAELKLILEAA